MIIIGGNSVMPILATTKFTPQMTITSSTSARSLSRMWSWAWLGGSLLLEFEPAMLGTRQFRSRAFEALGRSAEFFGVAEKQLTIAERSLESGDLLLESCNALG